MKLFVVAVGQRMPEWIDAGYEDYARRMPLTFRTRLIEVRAEPRNDHTPVARAVEAEAKRIDAAVPPGCARVVLDERGRSCTTRELAQRLSAWQLDARDVALIIGGADGLLPALRQNADWVWSLSALTLPHALVRVIVAEQLYRAASILGNHPYHRD